MARVSFSELLFHGNHPLLKLFHVTRSQHLSLLFGKCILWESCFFVRILVWHTGCQLTLSVAFKFVAISTVRKAPF